MFNFYSANKRYSARKYQNDMKKLWEENSEAVVQLVNHAVSEAKTAHDWASALANNQQRIANGIIRFYGERDGENTLVLFNQMIQCIGEAIDVFTWRKNEHKFRERWCLKADELCKVLHSFTKWNVREYFYKQILLIESIIKAVIRRDVEAITNYRQKLIHNNTALGDIFITTVIRDNAKLFY